MKHFDASLLQPTDDFFKSNVEAAQMESVNLQISNGKFE